MRQIERWLVALFLGTSLPALCSAATAVDRAMDPLSIDYDPPLETATRVVRYELPLSFGQATRARDPRQIQFGLKLVF